jgi:hypothetical protein
MRMSTRFCWYSSEKATQELGYEHRPIDEAMALALAELGAGQKGKG